MPSIWPEAPTPKSALNRYRILSPKCGLRVSPLQLGAMSIGEKWSAFMGSLSKEDAFKLMDTFADAGGNFIDTSNNYQAGQSEEWIGEWMAKRGNRDEIVLATKYTTIFQEDAGLKVNFSGNHIKSMMMSVEASLKKLQTSYIDILYLHWWDYQTSVEEVMQGLNVLVKSGKVLYLGVSDTPAWIVSKANQYARQLGLAQFVIYQGKWSLKDRDLEAEVIPMAQAEGMAIAPWGVLGQGKFQTSAEIERRRNDNELRYNADFTEVEIKLSAGLEKVGQEIGASVGAVALAYCMSKFPYVFPITGGRRVSHLEDQISALEISLTKDQIDYLESIVPYNFPFPYSHFGRGEPNFLMKGTGNYDWVPAQQPIQPAFKRA